jgi:hypothetical protein
MKNPTETEAEYYKRRAEQLKLSVDKDIASGVVRGKDVESFLQSPEPLELCRVLSEQDTEGVQAVINGLSLAKQDGLKLIFSKALLRRSRRA